MKGDYKICRDLGNRIEWSDLREFACTPSFPSKSPDSVSAVRGFGFNHLSSPDAGYSEFLTRDSTTLYRVCQIVGTNVWDNLG